MRRGGRVLALVVVLGLSTACAGDDPGTELPDTTASPSESVPPTPDPVIEPSPDDDPGATPDPSPDASPVVLAGEPYDGLPLGGAPALLDVIGVAADDVLNVRAGPGADTAVVATLAPLATDVPASGAARLLPGSIWLEVMVDSATGWANSSFFAFLGGTDDITAQLLADLDERPSAPTLEQLAEEIAALVASEDPRSDIVISDGPSVGDLGEVTVDVVGLGDDAVRGLRLVVFASEGTDGFTMRTVESTELCGRGGGDGGPCP